ncbi:hypothetical protein Tco_0611726 [Tanacetum coccineum]
MQNTMAEQNVPAQAPTRTDEQIISVDILRNTNFFRAFSASASVLAVYIQQFWNSIKKALDINPVDPAHPFELPPTGDTVIDFVNQLGYPEPVEFEEFTQGIQTFFSHKASHKASLKDPKKKAVPLLIPYGRFTKMIIYYLGSTSDVHKRPESPCHLPGDDFLLGNLKFISKGETDEVFGMAIPKQLITQAIQQSSYYPKYLEMVAKNTKKTPQDSASKQPEPATKRAPPKKPTTTTPVKPTKPPSSKQPKSPTKKPSKRKLPQKVRKGKPSFQLIDEEDEAQQESVPQEESDDPALELAKKMSLDAHQEKGEGEGADADIERAIKLSLDPSFLPQGQAPVGGVAIRDPVSETTPKLPEVVGKGKAIVTEEQVAHSLIDLSKKKRTTDQFILVRRDQAPHDSTTGPSSQPEDDTSEKVVHESSSTTDSERTESGTEAAAPKGDKEQGEVASSTVTSGVGISVRTEDQAGSDPGKAHEALAGPDPEPMQEDQTGSDSGKVHVSLAGPNPEHTDEEFLATAYPKVHENLKLITDEHVIEDNPESHSGSMSSMKNLEDTDNFGDQFLYDKPTEDDQEKSKVVDESDSTIPDPSHFIHRPCSKSREIEQDISEVKKTDHSAAVLASIQSQVPTVVDKYLETKLDDALLKSLKRHTADLVEKYSVLLALELSKKKHDSDDDEDDDDEGPSAGSNQGDSTKRRKHDSSASGLAQPPFKDSEQSTKNKLDSNTFAAQQPPTHTSSAWQITDTKDTPPGPLMQTTDHQSEQSSDDNPITDEGHVSDPEDTDNAHIPKRTTGQMYTPQRKKKLCKADLEGPTFNLVKAFHNNSVSLQFQMDECHKLLTDKVDLVTLRVSNMRNVYEPFPFRRPSGPVTIQPQLHLSNKIWKSSVQYFGLEELVSSLWVKSERDYNISAAYGITHWWFRRKEFCINKHREPSDRDAVRSHMRILSVISIKTYERYGYNYLREIVLRRADYKEYKLSEKDFKNPSSKCFEDRFFLRSSSRQAQPPT